MPSALCQEAVRAAQRVGSALLKFISPNDVGLTGAHQKGYYLPKQAWRIFTPFKPTHGVNNNHDVEAIWQDGQTTKSTVKWYGRGTRSEYRLTGFDRQKNFPFIATDRVGSLLVLIPEQINRFRMYVLDSEDDIEDFQAGIGVEVIKGWALYEQQRSAETEDECLIRRFQSFASVLKNFPPTVTFANAARAALTACVKDFPTLSVDSLLLRCVEAEYALFQTVERKLCEPEIAKGFQSLDHFLKTAQTILQRRKSRAGKSLEHHIEFLLREAGIPFEAHPSVDGTIPDLLIPGKREYLDPHYPESKLFAVGIKTTCKDRWRQVLREAPRVTRKHILTLQNGISPAQLDEMRSSSVTLIVPSGLHAAYSKDRRPQLLSVQGFIDHVKVSLNRK